MKYTNEALAKLIVSIDPDATSWVYNRHCESCGKFLYPESIEANKCIKCNTIMNDPIENALRFLTSATAFEKFVLWLKKQDRSDLIPLIEDAYSRWLRSNKSPDNYKQEIIAICMHRLV